MSRTGSISMSTEEQFMAGSRLLLTMQHSGTSKVHELTDFTTGAECFSDKTGIQIMENKNTRILRQNTLT